MKIGMPRRVYRIEPVEDPVPKACSSMSAQARVRLPRLRWPTPLADSIEFGDDVLVGIRLENVNGDSVAPKRTCNTSRVCRRPVGPPRRDVQMDRISARRSPA
jgi:hypothetical protein